MSSEKASELDIHCCFYPFCLQFSAEKPKSNQNKEVKPLQIIRVNPRTAERKGAERGGGNSESKRGEKDSEDGKKKKEN